MSRWFVVGSLSVPLAGVILAKRHLPSEFQMGGVKLNDVGERHGEFGGDQLDLPFAGAEAA